MRILRDTDVLTCARVQWCCWCAEKDTRFVFYGMRYIIDNYVARRWTVDDVEKVWST